ncbi:sterol carrier family protein [Demequina sp. SYSU T00068]|uniref:sterol carrier family protein n=1 Tax=Demequina lignilytica TaxID=3051663 RepID=UPI00262D29EF|nr:sterol carrier family protein [Demequina sp. SYSU T00068]MDN4491704.1 sterol carrier family protein [Demequina sp. SYSU T00068]
MPPRRRIPVAAGREALAAWGRGGADRPTTAMAVRFSLEELAAIAPGRSLEVRVPPFGAVQCVEGSVHRRGTPPAVVEMSPETWLGLVTGVLTWDDAVASGAVDASGERSDLSGLLPLDLG